MAIVSVLQSSTSLLASNRRTKVILSNEGANDVWCIFGAAAVLNEGFKLAAGAERTLDANKLDISEALNAIAETGATNVSVYELGA